MTAVSVPRARSNAREAFCSACLKRETDPIGADDGCKANRGAVSQGASRRFDETRSKWT